MFNVNCLNPLLIEKNAKNFTITWKQFSVQLSAHSNQDMSSRIFGLVILENN